MECWLLQGFCQLRTRPLFWHPLSEAEKILPSPFGYSVYFTIFSSNTSLRKIQNKDEAGSPFLLRQQLQRRQSLRWPSRLLSKLLKSHLLFCNRQHIITMAYWWIHNFSSTKSCKSMRQFHINVVAHFSIITKAFLTHCGRPTAR